MNLIYSIIAKICRKIEIEIRNSLFFSTLINIFYFFEKSLLNCYILKFYPQKELINIKKEFSPDHFGNILSNNSYADWICYKNSI